MSSFERVWDALGNHNYYLGPPHISCPLSILTCVLIFGLLSVSLNRMFLFSFHGLLLMTADPAPVYNGEQVKYFNTQHTHSICSLRVVILDMGVFRVIAMLGIKVKADGCQTFVRFDSLVHLRCLTNFKFRLFWCLCVCSGCLQSTCCPVA